MSGLEYYRRIQGMSLHMLAAASGVAAITISKMEHDVDSVTAKTAQKLSVALGVSVDQLLESHMEEETEYFTKQASFRSGSGNPNNCLERYRLEKHLPYKTLAERCGNTTTEAGRIACHRETPLSEHIQAVAAYEGMTAAEFMKKYGGNDGRI